MDDKRQVAGLAGALLMGGIMRAAASRPEVQLVGDWVLARHAGQFRAIAAVALPVVGAIMLYMGSTLWRDGLVLACFALMFAASAWLCYDIFGSTFRYNDNTLQLRRLGRRPIEIALQTATVEQHPTWPIFTIRDLAGTTIRFHADYRTGAVPLVNYLLGRAAAAGQDDQSGSPRPPPATLLR